VVTVIVVVPADRPVIKPVLELIEATPGLLDVQVTLLFEAFAGEKTGIRVVVEPTLSDAVSSRETLETAILLTVILLVAFTLVLSVEVAVIVALPGETPVTIPFATVATDPLDDDHVTALEDPEGEAVTVSVSVFPTPTLAELGDIDKEVGAVAVPHIKSAYSGWSMKGLRLP
jgi:multisubunit Na+/H+ antiporter MnhF subunit